MSPDITRRAFIHSGGLATAGLLANGEVVAQSATSAPKTNIHGDSGECRHPADIDVSFVDEFDPHTSPIGARGIGELGATGVAAAVANAVYDVSVCESEPCRSCPGRCCSTGSIVP